VVERGVYGVAERILIVSEECNIPIIRFVSMHNALLKGRETDVVLCVARVRSPPGIQWAGKLYATLTLSFAALPRSLIALGETVCSLTQQLYISRRGQEED
jgi:hypothetical protein